MSDETYGLVNASKMEAQEANNMLRTCAREDKEGYAARKALAQILEEAWKSGVFEPDTVTNIFTRIDVPAGADTRFPLDFFSPTREDWYKAVVAPHLGGVPTKMVEGDEAFVPTYQIENAVSWALRYARDARWDVVRKAVDVFVDGFTRTMNDEGWHVILYAANSNTVQSDSSASSGAFTKTLITELQTGAKRVTGGRDNRITDLYVSPEAIADLRNFDDDTVGDPFLSRLIMMGPDEIPTLYGVRIHELQELGHGYEYQTYLDGTVGASLATNDREFVVALNLRNRDAFVMPAREDMQMFDDEALHRQGKMGVYGWLEVGFAALDTRRALLGSY